MKTRVKCEPRRKTCPPWCPHQRQTGPRDPWGGRGGYTDEGGRNGYMHEWMGKRRGLTVSENRLFVVVLFTEKITETRLNPVYVFTSGKITSNVRNPIHLAAR